MTTLTRTLAIVALCSLIMTTAHAAKNVQLSRTQQVQLVTNDAGAVTKIYLQIRSLDVNGNVTNFVIHEYAIDPPIPQENIQALIDRLRGQAEPEDVLEELGDLVQSYQGTVNLDGTVTVQALDAQGEAIGAAQNYANYDVAQQGLGLSLPPWIRNRDAAGNLDQGINPDSFPDLIIVPGTPD